MIKVRIQLAGEGSAVGPKATPLSVTREILASGKALDLYTGLSAGLLRQAVYTTARLGFFDTFMGSLAARAQAKGQKVGFKERATAGLAAGGLAAMFGNPADLALIRKCTDYAVDAALRGESGVIGEDEERNGELRAIEFDRIAGGKRFDASVPWFTGLLSEIGQR